MNARTTAPKTSVNSKPAPSARPPAAAKASAPVKPVTVTPPDESEIEIEKGALAAFIKTLTPEQRTMWTPLRRSWRAEVSRAKSAASSGDGGKGSLSAAFASIKGKITGASLERLVNNAIAKGDANMFKVLATIAGEDLSMKPQEQTGPGAEVIICESMCLLSSYRYKIDYLFGKR